MSNPTSDPRRQLSAIDAELAQFEAWIGIISAGLLAPALAAYAALM